MNSTLTVGILPVLMIIAAASDATSLRIPNWVCGLLALLFVPMALVHGMAAQEFFWHLLTGVILFVAGYALFALRLFGGGDGKLMAAAGLWFGTADTMPFLVYTALAGGALVIVIALLAMVQTHLDYTGSGYSATLRKLAPKVPYGVALAIGAILAFPNSWWMQHVA
jgi:prepilin peptidase CpaA